MTEAFWIIEEEIDEINYLFYISVAESIKCCYFMAHGVIV